MPVPPNPLKGVIFDLDGTLLDTEPLATEAINRVLQEKLGPSAPTVSAELKRQILGMIDQDWARIVLQELNVPNDVCNVEEMIHDWHQHLLDLWKNVQALPGTYELINMLSQRKIPMAVATSSSASAVAVKRSKHHDMFKHFEFVVCGDDPQVKHGKPAPDIFLVAAGRLNMSPESLVVFEDSKNGVLAGKAAGMTAIAIPDFRIVPEQEKDEYIQTYHKTECDILLDSMTQFAQHHMDLFGPPN